MAHSRFAASGDMIGKGNTHNTKNLPASERLRAIFAERYLQAAETNYRHKKVSEKQQIWKSEENLKLIP